MKRRGWILVFALLALCLTLCACGGDREKPSAGEQALEEALMPNEKPPFTAGRFTLDGEGMELETQEAAKLLLEGLGTVEEEIFLPSHDAQALEKVYRLTGGELRCTMNHEDRAVPEMVSRFCAASASVEICGIRVGDPWTKVVDTFQIEEPKQTENTWGDQGWLLYGEDASSSQSYGFLALNAAGKPAYVFYRDEGALRFALDEAGAVKEIWYDAEGGMGERYTAPELLYPYADVAGKGAEACRGKLQNDRLKPMDSDYITIEDGTITVAYQMPNMASGDRFTMDRTLEMQDASVLFLSCPEALSVQFTYQYPLYDYMLSEVVITREMAQKAVGAALSAPDGGDWKNFDRRLREAYWYIDALDAVDFDHIAESAGDPLRDNDREMLTMPALEGVFPWTLTEDTAAQHLGTPSAAEDIPVFDGEAAYRVLTYAGGSMAGGWVSGSGKVESIGALYLTGIGAPSFNGVRIGDDGASILRAFCVHQAREANLAEYGEDLAIVLYGEVIHMGTYGYAVMEGEKFTQIVYGAGEAGVVTFFLDDEEKVSAIRFQMEEHMRLPLEE